MSQFSPDESKLSQLGGKVIVLTGAGGASGIGKMTARLLVEHGAHVVFGDVDRTKGEQHAADLNDIGAGGSAAFVACDITDYGAIYKLFRTAYDRHGRIDHAIANAGIMERGNWFDPELTVDDVGSKPETTQVLDVNIAGTSNFARIAVVFLRESFRSGKVEHPSLTLTGSVASFRESPQIPMYQASKHAVLGLMRAMRRPIYERDHIRVNCICPGFTRSAMTDKIFHIFESRGLATQEAHDVARFIEGVLVEDSMNGKSIYVEGNTGWEMEDGYWDEMDRWLGEKPTAMLKRNAEFVSTVSDQLPDRRGPSLTRRPGRARQRAGEGQVRKDSDG